MKRLSVIVARGAMVAALGAMTAGLAACGGHNGNSADTSSGPSKATATTSVAASTSASPAVSAAPSSATAASSPPANSTLGPASRTTCATFKNMSIDAEKTLVEKVLAENPGSKFQGSPNVALGTAKLVCLASSEQNKPIVVAIGIAQ